MRTNTAAAEAAIASAAPVILPPDIHLNDEGESDGYEDEYEYDEDNDEEEDDDGYDDDDDDDDEDEEHEQPMTIPVTTAALTSQLQIKDISSISSSEPIIFSPLQNSSTNNHAVNTTTSTAIPIGRQPQQPQQQQQQHLQSQQMQPFGNTTNTPNVNNNNAAMFNHQNQQNSAENRRLAEDLAEFVENVVQGMNVSQRNEDGSPCDEKEVELQLQTARMIRQVRKYRVERL